MRLAATLSDMTGRLKVRTIVDTTLVPRGQCAGIEQMAHRHLIVDDCDYYAEVTDDGTHAVTFGGVTLYGGYLRNQWGHFIMNSTARLWPLFGPDAMHVDRVVFFTDDEQRTTLRGNYAELMQLAGLASKVMIVSHPFRAETLLVPDMAFEHDSHYAYEFNRLFDHVAEKVDMAQEHCRPEKVFLSRSALPGARRNEINSDLLDRLLEINGFVTVHPEKMSLSEMIRTLLGASEIAAVSGSLAHNLMFAHSGTPAVILERTPVNNLYQIGVNRLRAMRPDYVDCYSWPVPAPSTGAVFLYTMTDTLASYCRTRGWHTEEGLFAATWRSRYRELRRYVAACRRNYGICSGIREWEAAEADVLIEALLDGEHRYADIMRLNLPVCVADLLSPRKCARLLRTILLRR